MVLFMQIDTSSVLRRIEIRLAEIEMPKQVFYEKSGISSGSYSQWNTGMHSPSLKKLQKAALVLGVPVEYLLYGDASAASQGAKKALDPEIKGGREAVSNFISATNDRAALLAIINEATKKLQEME
jgi:transcriptional regulator with XRE-family HTH domain